MPASRAHRDLQGFMQASPFSLFAKDLPPITSLHAYAESFPGKLFSPDGKVLPARWVWPPPAALCELSQLPLLFVLLLLWGLQECNEPQGPCSFQGRKLKHNVHDNRSALCENIRACAGQEAMTSCLPRALPDLRTASTYLPASCRPH